MNILYLLIPLTLILVTLSLAGFFWAIQSDQYDDLTTPAQRMLFEDEMVTKQEQKKGKSNG